MNTYVLALSAIDKTNHPLAGGKGANLGELTRIKGILVPDGFCITTDAYKRIVAETPPINELLNQLSLLTIEDRDAISKLSSAIRKAIEAIAIPEDIIKAITQQLSRLGENNS